MARKRRTEARGSRERGGVQRPETPATPKKPFLPEWLFPIFWWRLSVEAVRRNAALLIILAVAATLRLVWLDRQDLWVDEVFTREDALKLDLHAPFRRFHWLAFVFYRIPSMFTDSVWWLRFPSALAGILAIAAFYRLARMFFEKPDSLRMAALLAIMPSPLNHSMDARYYAMVLLFSILAYICIARFALRSSLSALLLFFVFSGAAYLCHPAAGGAMAGAFGAGCIWTAVTFRAWLPRLKERWKIAALRIGGKTAAWILFSALLLLLAGIAVVSWRVIHAHIIQRVVKEWDAPLTERISFSWQFFLSHFYAFSRGRWTIGLAWPPWTAGMLSLAGMLLLWWRRRFAALFSTLAFLVGLSLLFIVKADIPYAYKYSTALIPGMVLGLGELTLVAGRALARLSRRGDPQRWAYAAAAAIALLWSQSLYLHYTGQLMPIKATAQTIKNAESSTTSQSFQPEATSNLPPPPRPVVFMSPMARSVSRYYPDYIGLNMVPVDTYSEMWSRDALLRFIRHLGISSNPLWIAELRGEKIGLNFEMDTGSWNMVKKIPALITQYDMFLYRFEQRVTSQDKRAKNLQLHNYFEAENFDRIKPPEAAVLARLDKNGVEIGETLACIHPMRTYYSVNKTTDGPAIIGLVARNSASVPRWVGMRWNDQPLGVVTFPANADDFSTRTLIFSAPPGTAVLTICPLASTLPDGKNYDAESRIEFDRFYFFELQAGNIPPSLRSNSLFSPADLLDVGTPGGLVPIESVQSQHQISPVWTVLPAETPWRIDFSEEEKSGVLVFEVDPNEKAVSIITPWFPAQAGKIIYGTIEVRCENLHTHAGNVMVDFRGEKGEILRMKYADSRNFHGNEDWRRFTFFQPIPKEATYMSLAINVWRTASPSAISRGTVSIRNFRIDPPSRCLNR